MHEKHQKQLTCPPDSKKNGKDYLLQAYSSIRRIVAMAQPISYRRGFDRFALEPELGPVEFEMALDIEEQVTYYSGLKGYHS